MWWAQMGTEGRGLVVFLVVVLAISILALGVVWLKLTFLRISTDKTAAETASRLLHEWKEKELGAVKKQYQDMLEESLVAHKANSEQAFAVRLAAHKASFESEIRKDAVSRSRAVVAGKVTEHLVPFLPGFRFNPKDARFLGSPVDLIVFDGLDAGALTRIVFLEVKTGASALTTRERQIRDVINAHKVEWRELRKDPIGAS